MNSSNGMQNLNSQNGQNPNKRITSFKDNCKIENSEQAEQAIREAILAKFGSDTLIKKVTEKELQLRGIDYKIKNPKTGRVLNIDVKVRDASSCEKYWKGNQDIAIEFKQGNAEYGWGNDPNSLTDYVLFIWLNLQNDQVYRPYFFVKHRTLDSMTRTEDLRDLLILAKKAKVNSGFNGYAYSHFLTMSVAEVEQFASFQELPIDELLRQARAIADAL